LIVFKNDNYIYYYKMTILRCQVCGTTFKKMSACLNHSRVKNGCLIHGFIGDTKGELQASIRKYGTLTTGNTLSTIKSVE